MKKILCSFLVIVLIISSSTIGFSQIVKDETVYVKLNHDGSVDSTMVVNHLSGSSEEEYFIDYGKYTELEPLVTDLEIKMENDFLKLPTKLLEEKDIYYQGKIDNPIPMNIKITYFLDGKEVKAEELLGKDGNMKIVIAIKDSDYFTTQIQIPLSLKKFSNIKSQDGVQALVGKTMTVAFNHLPIGDSEFTLEADGKNIELEQFIISASLMDIQLPGDIGGDLNKLSTGIGDISNAVTEISNGSNELSKGSVKLRNGLSSLSSGIAQFFNGMKSIDSNTKEVVKGFGSFNSGLLELKDNISNLTGGVTEMNNGLKKLGSEGTNIQNGLQQLNGGTKELNSGLSAVSKGLGELNQGHEQLVQLAQLLQNNSDPNVVALAQGVISEAEAIKSLSSNTSTISSGLNEISQNLNMTSLGYREYNKGLTSIVAGFDQFSEGIKPLPTGINTMYEGHTQLVNGLEELSKGISTTTNGIKSLDFQTKNLPNEVSKIVDGQNKITSGLNEINEQGLKEIETSINTFNSMGNDEPKDDYTSFVDSRNENTRTGFIMNTPAVNKDTFSAENQAPIVENDNRTIIQRFLDLFRK